MTRAKAQIQIQFNWVFVIIIGSVFLIFFFSLINNESKTNEDRISISQSKYFETVITSTGQRDGTLKEYELQNLEVKFVCNADENEYGYSVEHLPARDTKYDILFTRNYLKGKDIQTWTQQWEVPFKAGTFLYITNSNQGYIFYNISANRGNREATSRFKDVYGSFPKNISVEVVDDIEYSFEDVKQRNYESNTYIILWGDEAEAYQFESFEGVNNPRIVYIVSGKDAKNFFEYGTVYFLDLETYKDLREELIDLENDKDDYTVFEYGEQLDFLFDGYEDYASSYLGKASLYGAIFSEDKAVYDCNMEKAIKRLQLITHMYWIRTESFISGNVVSYDCQLALGLDDYLPEEGNIELFLFPSNRLWALQEHILPKGIPYGDDLELTYHYLFELEDDNKALSTISRCPSIY